MHECKLCAWIRERPANATNAGVVSVDDRFPVAPGHVLVLPRRHEPDFFQLEPAEQWAIWQLVARERERLVTEYRTEHFTIGMNVGVAAGQTVPHAHVHVIPRVEGDVDDPRGGIRGVIPRNRLY